VNPGMDGLGLTRCKRRRLAVQPVEHIHTCRSYILFFPLVSMLFGVAFQWA
jgi:hypothetical protein